MSQSDPSAYLPLPPRTFAMLAVLAAGPTHGYSVMQQVNQTLGRTAFLGPGTLYRVLKELRDEGLIEESAAPDPAADQRRRYYRLTALGQVVAETEAERLGGLVHAVQAGLARSDGGAQ